MTNLSLTVRYRPARIGWCIRDGNWEDIRSALRLTQIFWGGVFNPLIPLGASANHLINKFRVDVLFPVNKSAEAVAFTGTYDSLRWPLFETELIRKFGEAPNFLDVSHPLKKIAAQVRLQVGQSDQQDAPPQGFESSQYVVVKWANDDPLADVLLATFGAYPGTDQTGRDYEGFLLTNIRPFLFGAKTNGQLPAELMDHSSVCDITASDLQWDRIPADKAMGFYVGKADDFQDIVNYWNLRAAEINVLFLDPSHTERMQPLRAAYSQAIIKSHIKSLQQPLCASEARRSPDSGLEPITRDCRATRIYPKGCPHVPTYRWHRSFRAQHQSAASLFITQRNSCIDLGEIREPNALIPTSRKDVCAGRTV
jgi:hypothetical protein